MNILVTGGTGFVGTSLLNRLMCLSGVTVCTAIRQADKNKVNQNQALILDDTGCICSPEKMLGFDAVIHTAARVHQMSATNINSEIAACNKVNNEFTQNLAKQAAAAGVKRFLFLSSIKVNGEQTEPNQSFCENSPPSPSDPYSVSKYEAEQGLWEISRETGMEIVIIRPPLVYGPGVKANFLRMLQWLERGVPLPLGGINNQRSLVALDNLVDFICLCVEHPAAANQLFLVSDDHDLSTPALLHSLAGFMKTPDRVFSIPSPLLNVTARLLGKSNEIQRLCGSLQVDITKAKELLGWKPPVPVEHALKEAAEWYVKSKRVGTDL